MIANLRAKQEWWSALAIVPRPRAAGETGFFEDNQLYPYVSLLYGIELLEWMRDWCERTAEKIEAEEASAA